MSIRMCKGHTPNSSCSSQPGKMTNNCHLPARPESTKSNQKKSKQSSWLGMTDTKRQRR